MLRILYNFVRSGEGEHAVAYRPHPPMYSSKVICFSAQFYMRELSRVLI